MTDHERHDPFDALAAPVEPQQARPAFRRELRARLVAALGLDATDIPTIHLPERKPMTSTDTPTPTTAAAAVTVVTPYLTVAGGARAIDWYREALGAVEQFRVVDDTGRVSHAELLLGDARFMLSDEHPEIGVTGPATLGGTSVALHVEVADVDTAFARAVDAGATALAEPADQPHGARHGTLIDPFGHRWMLSQTIEQVNLDDYAERASDGGYRVERARRASTDGIWALVSYRDALAGIRFLVDVLGFEEQLVVVADDGTTVEHSQIRWPEGGLLQADTYVTGNEFMLEPGTQSLYVITQDPQAVWERCQAAGVEVVRPPESPHYDPDGMGFSIRDPEGNIFSFGTYAGQA